MFELDNDSAKNETDESAKLLEALRRISATLYSDLDFTAVLQSIVDVISDQTDWKLSWIMSVDLGAGVAEVLTRRDRAFHTASDEVLYQLRDTPSFEVVRTGEALVIEDAQNCDQFPAYSAGARERGLKCGIFLPLNATDVRHRPMVLAVHSEESFRRREHQIPFLNTVTHLAGLAIKNAQRLADERKLNTETTASAEMLSEVVQELLINTPPEEALELIEAAVPGTLIVLDRAGRPIYSGRSPSRTLSDEEWVSLLRQEVLPLVTTPAARLKRNGAEEQKVSNNDLNLNISTEELGYGSSKLGTLAIVTDDRFKHEQSAPTVALVRSAVSMVLLRHHIEFQTEVQIKGELLSDLLSGSFSDKTEAFVRAANAGLAFDVPNLMALIVPERQDHHFLADTVLQIIEAESRAWSGAVASLTNHGIVALLPLMQREDFERGMKWITKLHDNLVTSLGIEVSIAVSEPCEALEDYPSTWRSCISTSHLAAVLSRSGVQRVEELGGYRFLLSAASDLDVNNFLDTWIGPVIKYDKQHDSELLTTLELFLGSGGKYQQTADRLFIHVSTLRYRLERIQELRAINLEDEDSRFQTLLALKIKRLMDAV